MNKRFISLLLTMCLICSMLPVTARAAIGGSCGNGVSWSFDSGTNNLTISGYGTMNDFSYNGSDLPWYGYRNLIDYVRIESGVKNIGAYAFYQTPELQSIRISKTVTSINASAFQGCEKLTGVYFDTGSELTTISSNAFYWCTMLNVITIPANVSKIESFAFSHCDNLREITFQGNAPTIERNAFTSINADNFTRTAYYPQNDDTWNELAGQNAMDAREYHGSYLIWTPYCPHTWMAATCTEPKICTSCGETSGSPLGHNYVDGICTRCGDVSYGGSFDENLNWTLDSAGKLTITGIGPMADYSSSSDAPWYAHKEKISSIEISEGVTHVGSAAFAGYANVTSVRIADSVQSVGKNAFYDCQAVTELSLGSGLTLIDEGAFGYLKGLTSLVIPDSVTVIRDKGFQGCQFLQSVTLPKNLQSIGGWAFSDCALTSVVIPEGVTQIGSSAFWLCGKMTSLTLPSTLETIGQNAFSSCDLRTVTIPRSVTSIGDSVFSGNANLTEINVEEGNVNYCSDSGVLYTADHTSLISFPGGKSGSYEVDSRTKNISANAFNKCKYVTGITLPDGLESIGKSAFYNCTKLLYINIPAGITVIPSSAFTYCTNLEEIILPSGLTEIHSNAFFGCVALSSITFKGNAPSIGSNAFYDVTAYCYYPAGNTTWNEDTMLDYNGTLFWVEKEIDPDYVASGSCGRDLTWGIDALGTLYISGNGRMDDYSEETAPWYSYRDSIQAVVIRAGVTGIGNYAFYHCGSLSDITVPENVTDIGSNVFEGCTGLTSVSILGEVEQIDSYTFLGCNGLTSVDLPESLTYLCNNAFEGCTGLTHIKLPDNVTTIDLDAFKGCTNLKSIMLPESLTVVAPGAFDGCNSLSTVFYRGTETQKIAISFMDPSDPLLSDAWHYQVTDTTYEDMPAYLCGMCGYYCAPDGTVLGHNHTHTPVVTEPTCTDSGYTTYTCACGDTYTTEETDALGHAYVDGFCTRCGKGEPIYSGSCGENVTWELDAQGTLTIFGKGAMDDYATASGSPWYSQRELINSVIVEDNVTTIGDRAFYNCTELLAVTIGQDVETIGTYAFRGCTALEEVSIPACVTELKASAFRVCSMLATVTFEGNAPTIGSFVFQDCDAGLTIQYYEGSTGFDAEPWTDYARKALHVGEWIVDVESTCTTTGSRHIDCSYCGETFTETILGGHHYVDGVCSVCHRGEILYRGTCGSNLIWELDILGTLYISGAGEMEDYYFAVPPWHSYRASIQSLVIDAGVTYIGSYAFYQCSSLTNVSLSESVATIEESAFEGCSSLTNITIPKGVRSIVTTAFLGCNNLTAIYVDEDNAYYSSDSNGILYDKSKSKLVRVPQGINGHYVIPQSVTGIGYDAFNGCTGLTCITIPESVTSIGGSAFYGCSSLTDITIPAGVTVIRWAAFEGCSSLASITIPDGVTSIENNAFRKCTSLSCVNIPQGVVTTGQYVFEGCTSLRSITIPESMTGISDFAFENCSSLTDITIPESITSIGRNAFYGCSALTSIIIPDSVSSIGMYAFSYCTGLTEIIIPDSAIDIDHSAFRNCSSLTSITIPDSMTSIGEDLFWYCSNLTGITIPESVSSIGDGAFDYCRSLSSVFYRGTEAQRSEINIGDYNENLTSATWHYEVTDTTYEGQPAYLCGKCGAYYSPDGTRLGHKHMHAAAVTPPTCTEPGYTTYTCACGDIYTSDEVTALGHNYAYGKCVRCGEKDPDYIPEYSIAYTQVSVSLAGDIGLNYYATLSEDLMADEDAYMEFLVEGELQFVPISQAVITTASDGSRTYRFTCKVSARQMTDNIVGQMYASDGTAVGEGKAFSVKAYCDKAIAAYGSYASYANLVNLMKAMLNYGGYSQIKFGYNTGNLANADLEDKSLPNITAADLAGFAHGKEGTEAGINIQSVSLLLESTTTIRFYFKLDGSKPIESYTFVVDGEVVEPVHYSGTTYYVDKVGVPARELDVNSYVEVGGLRVWYCGMSYVRQILNSSTDTALINACKALYAYSEAANAYFK